MSSALGNIGSHLQSPVFDGNLTNEDNSIILTQDGTIYCLKLILNGQDIMSLINNKYPTTPILQFTPPSPPILQFSVGTVPILQM